LFDILHLLQEAEQKKVVAGYQETETFECKMCNNGKSLRVEMEHVSWMTDVRTEKTAFDVSVLLIVSLEVFFCHKCSQTAKRISKSDELHS